jgi:hypothetical protein
VLAAEHLLGFAGVDLGRQLVDAPGEIFEDGLAGFDPLDQDGEVVGAALEGVAEGQILFEASAALQQLLGGCLVLPEVRVGDALLYGGELFCRMGRVKDSSADRRRGAPGPDACEAVRRVVGPSNAIVPEPRYRRSRSPTDHQTMGHPFNTEERSNGESIFFSKKQQPFWLLSVLRSSVSPC